MAKHRGSEDEPEPTAPEAEEGEEQAKEEAATAVAEEAAGDEEKPPKPLNQQVEVIDAGPCRKHIKVSIPRSDIDERLNEKFSEMVTDAVVPGYRPGKAPRKLIEKKYYHDVSEQIKAEILLQSLEQLGEQHKLMPLSQPDLDPFKIELPKDGPLSYEFEVEVAPEFELPEYKGLKLRRPTREFTEDELAKQEHRMLARLGTLVPKDSPAELEDFLIADITVRFEGKELNKMTESTVKIDARLAFRDGLVRDFGDKMKGVRAGETRTVQMQLSPTLRDEALRSKTVDMVFDVKDVKSMRLPELTHEFLHDRFGVHSPEQLREKVRADMQRQLEYEQRRSARGQVLQHIAAAATWELPHDLLNRQARRTFGRRMLEMRKSGFSEEEIRGQVAMLQQDALTSTERALKEHFVLQKIADVEKVEVTDEDIEFEIEVLAVQTNENPRRVRARLEKEDLMETLTAEILEKKALDLVLEHAVYEDVPLVQEASVGAVEEQAVPSEEPEFEPGTTGEASKEATA